ncbi:maleylpyruvate isomerase family mycothiol-dependent enzyme [Dactylosporangium vinaceum]|uniref:Maleylpyruvate isomerase family mycothiol-dependent enzyme n=1 Tax=Dactylosporangium vinaceum TaxID=53362 RepID=A0ABV5M8W6_9ACTN|nr:maleylpyruvate isomerase family mycothiol-dependent enzyme [Dactylosporangium vinaceum]UAB99532.1 maleylpyruvate isomerase family mycothiol-dependent enzyme [Dactylosporangium vinaceum]
MTFPWSTMDDQRATVADLLESLTPEEWARPSLCTAWTVRDVAAHLTMQQLGVRDMLVRAPIVMRAKGDMNRAIHDMTVAQVRANTDAELVAGIRASIGSRRHTVGVTRYETLTDILVHTQDIAIPLGRTIATPPQAAAVAATRMMTMRWPRPFPIKQTLRLYCLEATDTAWRHGTGPLVQGPMGALLLLVCGRPAALDRLSGDGRAELERVLRA